MKYRHHILFCLLAITISTAAGQSPPTAGCDYLINKAGMYRLSAVQPGQTICVQAGHYEWLRFLDISGAPGNPVRIVNYGGQVTVGGTVYYAGMQFFNDRYFVLDGRTDPQLQYGFKVTQTGAGASAVNINGKSSDCEVAGIEVAQAGFAGIMVKTDPSCDPSTWRDAFTMQDVNIHHNYVHDVQGEGLYLGSSFWNGQTINCNGISQRVYPHTIMGLSVHHNRVERTGAEGLQYACAPDADVHHNSIRQPGQAPFAAYQNNGLQIGGGAGGRCWANVIQQVPGNGLIIIGHLGNNLIANNVISDIGENGVFCDDREGSLPNTYAAFINNTLVRCGHDGFRLYNQNNTITLDNNVVVGLGPYYRPVSLLQGATVTPRNLFFTNDLNAPGFTDQAGSDFRPTATSPLVDTGRDVSAWTITTDVADNARPQNGLYDIGAYEFGPDSPAAAGPGRVAARMPDRDATRNAVVLSPVTSPDDPDANHHLLTVYPSPASDQVTLHLTGTELITTVTLYTAGGQPLRARWSCVDTSSGQLDIRALPAGSYVVQCRAGSIWHTGRFVKQ